MDQVVGTEPSPEFAMQVASVTPSDDELDHRIAGLPDPELREIALFKLEGLTNTEIAEQLGCVRRTVERRLQLIRNIWEAV